MAGRGAGKTRSGAEDISEHARTHPGYRYALVAPTNDDVRDTMVEGESGLLSILPSEALRGGAVDTAWNRSLIELYFANGAKAKGFSSERPNKLRGPQHHRAWCEEVSSWENATETWDMLMFGLRLGDDPQAVVTTTPKPTALIKQLVKDPRTHITRGSTYDNLDNLAATFKAKVIGKYEGTRLGRQELHAELLEDVIGALWTVAGIEQDRVSRADTAMVRVVVAIDPSGGDDEGNDEQGIIVAGKGADGHGYVLTDRSGHHTPHGWATKAIDAYREFKADRVVAEINYGGAMVENTLRQVDSSIPYKTLTASRGKQARAEPIAALYEQHRIHHVGSFETLEEQMTTWVPGQPGRSPDRMDALVWAFTELFDIGGLTEYLALLAPQCHKCAHPNPAGAPNCASCGTPLVSA